MIQTLLPEDDFNPITKQPTGPLRRTAVSLTPRPYPLSEQWIWLLQAAAAGGTTETAILWPKDGYMHRFPQNWHKHLQVCGYQQEAYEDLPNQPSTRRCWYMQSQTQTAVKVAAHVFLLPYSRCHIRFCSSSTKPTTTNKEVSLNSAHCCRLPLRSPTKCTHLRSF